MRVAPQLRHHLLYILPGCVCLSGDHSECSTVSWSGAWHVSAYTSEVVPCAMTSHLCSLSMDAVPSRNPTRSLLHDACSVMIVEADRAGACTRIGQRDARRNDDVHAPTPTNRESGHCCSNEGTIPSPSLDIYKVSRQPNLGQSTTLVTACISTPSHQDSGQQQALSAAYVARLMRLIQSIPMMSIKAAPKGVCVRIPFLWHFPSSPIRQCSN